MGVKSSPLPVEFSASRLSRTFSSPISSPFSLQTYFRVVLPSYNNKIFTRRQQMDEIWDLDSTSGEHTVNVHINRLRERFRDNPDFEIVTVRGLGYKAVKKG